MYRPVLVPRLALVLALAQGCGGGGSDAPSDAALGDTDAAGGSPDSAPLEVTVTTFVEDVQAPLELLAVQEGDGAWRRLTSADGAYTFAAPSGRYALAHVCDYEVYADLIFFSSTLAETPSPVRRCSGESAVVDGSIQTTISNLVTDTAGVAVGNDNQTATIGAPTVVHEGVAPGTHDVWARLQSATGVLEGVMVERGVAVTGGAQAVVAMDVAADAVATSDFALSVTGATETEGLGFGAHVWSTRGTDVYLMQPTGTSYAGVPASALAENDVHVVSASAVDVAADSLRSVRRFIVAPAATELALPPAFEPTSVHAAATSPVVRVEMTFDAYDGAILYVLHAAQATGPFVRWEATAGWFGDVATATWEQPDLSGLDGWDATWALADDVEILWLAQAHASPVMPELLEAERPPSGLDGVIHGLAEQRGSFVP